MNTLGQLTEQHQFIIAVLAQLISLVSMIFLYRSTPGKKNDNSDQSNKPS